MIIFKKAKDLNSYISTCKAKKLTTGYVPTMGALHAGHLSLIAESKNITDVTVCSIFINPAQFNNPEDLAKYPVTAEQDVFLLQKNNCDVLFMPDVKEIYPNQTENNFIAELGYLENILEGKYRPGHFSGVCRVVKRLLEIIQPDIMFLGQKDYQQCMVLGKLLQQTNSKVSVTICETVREKDGLAMSSRNMSLNKEERIKAAEIFKVLSEIKNDLSKKTFVQLKQQALDNLAKKGFKTDYVEIADADTLLTADEQNTNTPLIALIAVYLNDIRLIDNLKLN